MTEKKKVRGWGAMSPEARKRIASSGGKSATAKGTRHVLTAEDRARGAETRKRNAEAKKKQNG